MNGTIVALTLASLYAGPGQEGAVPRLSFHFGVGTVSGGPADALVDDMRHAGLDEREEVFCFFGCDERRPYPQIQRRDKYGPASLAAGLSYRIGGRPGGALTWGLRLSTSKDDFPRVVGYRSEPYHHIMIDSTAFVGSAMLMVTVGDVVRVAAGPSINSLRVQDCCAGGTQWAHRPGVALEAAVMVPIRPQVFLDVSAQSRTIPDTRFGPYPLGIHGDVLPGRELPFRHVQLTAGIGFRRR